MKNNIFLNLKKKSINNNHFVISIFFETIYQFETKDTLLECFKNITTFFLLKDLTFIIKIIMYNKIEIVVFKTISKK